MNNDQNNSLFCGVILAAGNAKRIQPLSLEIPKPLLPVANKPIIQHQIEIMRKHGIKNIFVVIGYLGDQIKKNLGNGSRFGVHLTYITQKKQLGIAHAVSQAEPFISKSFLLCLGDIFFLAPKLKRALVLFQQKQAGAVLATAEEKNPDAMKRNFAVYLHPGSNRVKRVLEKPYYPKTNLKGCGIYLFNLEIFDAIRNTPRTAMRDEYEITSSIQILIDNDLSVYSALVVENNMNITTPKDLLVCNMKWLKAQKKENLISNSAKIGNHVYTKNAVIGERVILRSGVIIKDSVILDNSKILSKQIIQDSIVTPTQSVVCQP